MKPHIYRSDHFHMYQDHKLWKSESNMWLHDIANWDKESEHAVSELKQIIEDLHNHMSAYENHRKAIMEEIELLGKHEKDLVELEEGSETDIKLANYHYRIGEKHKNFQQAHERIKKYHHKMMALISSLKKAIEGGM